MNVNLIRERERGIDLLIVDPLHDIRIELTIRFKKLISHCYFFMFQDCDYFRETIKNKYCMQ